MDLPAFVSCWNGWSGAGSLAVLFYIVWRGKYHQGWIATSSPSRGGRGYKPTKWGQHKRSTMEEESSPPLPSFGPCPDTPKDYNFDDKVVRLPFQFNLGDAPFSKEQQDHLLNLVYNHQKVFPLHVKDLGFCDKLAHSVPTMTDKSVYLPHRMIPRQLQGEVQKCLDTWLRQSIIRPSKSYYASRVVILRKKTRQIWLCVDHWKLNSIVVRDTFPLPCIDEALQGVHNCQWFMSFDLAQGYLQMPVEEADIQKAAFRVGSSGLYEFTHMQFWLSNSGCSFCHFMEMCLGDQWFVTLLLYLDDICVFATSIDEVLDHIELLFKWLEEFNLKIKSKMPFLSTQHTLSGVCTICRWYICKLQEGR